MVYFSRRNKHIIEFSGYEEVSSSLRTRLLAVFSEYVQQNTISYRNEPSFYVDVKDFYYEVQKEFPKRNPGDIIQHGQFHEVFTVIEIFLHMAKSIDYTRRVEAPQEIAQAFDLSGSVYIVKNDQIELRVDEELAKGIESAKPILTDNASAYERFFEAVGNLLGRKAKIDDIIKDIFVSFEDYLKFRTGKNDYGGSMDYLKEQGLISATQKALLEKIYAYRSDTYGVGHAGNSSKPEEIDALWFIETVIAQIRFIDKKLKPQHVNHDERNPF